MLEEGREGAGRKKRLERERSVLRGRKGVGGEGWMLGEEKASNKGRSVLGEEEGYS